MARRVLPRNKLDARDRQVAGEGQVAGQLPQRLNLRGHDDTLPLDALGSAEAPAQVLGRLVVRPAAAEHENVPKTAPEHSRILFAVCTFQLRGRLDAGHDSQAVFSSLGQSVFE